MKDQIYFTKVERNGLILLGIFVTLVFVGRHLVRTFYEPSGVLTEEKLRKIIDEFETKSDNEEEALIAYDGPPLDPNSATEEQLVLVGLRPRTAKNLINYREAGKVFRSVSDVSTVFGMDSLQLHQLSKYLFFPRVQSPAPRSSQKLIQQSRSSQPFDPNVAPLDELLAQGLSSYAANSLINYRNSGAVFYDLKDLKRVYGITEAMLDLIKPRLIFPTRTVEVRADSNSAEKLPIIARAQPKTIDPNSASQEELEAIGLSQGLAKTLINFRSFGAKFSKLSDLSTVYGMNDSLLAVVEPWLLFANKPLKTQSDTVISVIRVNLNTATIDQLKSIKGIGKFLSEQIIDYRERLGGYHSIDQLRELEYLRPETYDAIKSQIYVNGAITKFIPMALTFKEVLRHPYTDYESTKLLYNIKAADFEEEIDILIKKGAIDARLTPYLLAED
ncbi:MAG: helix-hairpin-helix domain-containing protein [Bacteroidota bacterium]